MTAGGEGTEDLPHEGRPPEHTAVSGAEQTTRNHNRPSYASAKRAGDLLAQRVQDLATLIGEPATQPVTFGDGVSVVPGLGMLEDATALRARARDLRQGLFTIVVVGEFKNGKS